MNILYAIGEELVRGKMGNGELIGNGETYQGFNLGMQKL